jgi:hypothetical protein
MHLRIFTSSTLVDFVTPVYADRPPLNRPVLSDSADGPTFLDPSALGAPIYEHRSRMSDGRRVVSAGRYRMRLSLRGRVNAFFARVLALTSPVGRRPPHRRSID